MIKKKSAKATLIFLIVFLALTLIQSTIAPNYHLPKNTTIKTGLKVHFGPYWISTSGTPITITIYFEANWLNYTSNAGTQHIYNGTKPEKVYFDNVEQTEGTTWSCSGAVVTITPPSTDVAVLWGAAASDNKPTYSNVGSDETQAGKSCTLSSLWDDDNGLSDYEVEHNNTGPFHNITDSFSGTPGWASETITLNDTVGVVVAWRTHGNDTINQWNTTAWQYITITPPEPTFQTHANAQNYQVYGDNFYVLFESGSSLGFQNDIDKTVLLEIESGVLNSSDNKVILDIGGGDFRFTALNNTEIKITYTVSNVKVSGDQDNEYRPISSGSTITVETGNNVIIQWDTLIEPWLPIMFIFGMIGLASMFGGPLYAVNKLKKGEYYEALRSGLVVSAIGVAFVLAWLW